MQTLWRHQSIICRRLMEGWTAQEPPMETPWSRHGQEPCQGSPSILLFELRVCITFARAKPWRVPPLMGPFHGATLANPEGLCSPDLVTSVGSKPLGAPALLKRQLLLCEVDAMEAIRDPHRYLGPCNRLLVKRPGIVDRQPCLAFDGVVHVQDQISSILCKFTCRVHASAIAFAVCNAEH